MNRKQRRSAQKTGTSAAPGRPELLLADAVRKHQAGALAEAEAAYRQAIALRPGYAEAHYNLGIALHVQRRFAEAIACYRKALASRPADLDALSNLGGALADSGAFDESIAVCRRALMIDPRAPSALNNLGTALLGQRKLDEAEAVFREAHAADPRNVWACINLSAVLQQQSRTDEAIAMAQRALALDANAPLARFNLAMCLAEQGRSEESIAAFRATLALAPTLTDARFGLAQALLLSGRFAEGWSEYESRWQLAEYGWVREIRGVLERPRWSGENIAGKTLLVYAEQGLGDTLQFMRYMPRVIASGARIVFMVQPALKPLLGGIRGLTVIGMDEEPPTFDVHSPLLSLPHIFRTTRETIPAKVPYLAADPAAIERWRGRIGEHGLRIGIAWQGKPGVKIDKGRSIPLASFAPLAAVPGVRLISLQKNAGVEQLAQLPAGMAVETLGTDVDASGAFLDTAAAMMALDLVVTSDTAMAHLAGALGCPTWLALKHTPEWRWGAAGEQSPWYPSMRLFRQPASGDWDAVFAAMAQSLSTKEHL